MPTAAPEPSPALTARYRLERSEEWEIFLRRLRRRDSFAFLQLFAPEDSGVEIARRALATWAEENSVPLVFHTLLPDGPADSLTRLLIDGLEKPDAIHWIQATPLDPTGDKETQLAARWHDPVAALNSRRNSLQETLRAPLIFAAPEELSPYLRDHAVDLWDIRGISTYLPPPEAEPYPSGEFQPIGSGIAIPGDPEFTLGLARELEGQPNRAEERAALLSRAGRQALYHWDLPLAESLLRESLRISREIDSGPEILWLQENYLSQLLNQQGHLAEAVSHALAAQALAETAHGSDSSQSASALNNLAQFYRAQGNYTAAEPVARRALEIGEANLGKNHPDVASWLNNLASVLQHQGKLAEAEPLQRRAIEIGEATLGKDNTSVAIWLNNLALLLQAQGKSAEAEPLLRRAIEISEAKLGKDHPDVATWVNNLALLLQDQGKLAEAEPLYRRAIEISEAKLGKENPIVAIRLNSLAHLLQAQGKPASAEPLLHRALNITELTLGSDHPDFAIRLNNLANLLCSQRRFAEAEPLYRRAIEISEAKLGKDHPTIATWLNNLATLLQDQGALAAADPLYRRGLGIAFLHQKRNGTPFKHEELLLKNYTLLLSRTLHTPEQIKEKIAAIRREAGLDD